jgi:hypothetical protein
MNKIHLLLISTFFVASSAFAQFALTYKNNAPLVGDSIRTQSIENISPGGDGLDQVWDFSKIQFTNEKATSFLTQNPSKLIDGIGSHNATLNDKAYEYVYNIGEDKSEIVGLMTNGLTVVFSDPILKIKYPVAFGTYFTDGFTGNGADLYKSNVAVSGTNSFKADGYGTLKLRDKTLNNVLRVKIEENKIQLNPCSVYEMKTTTYFWYAPTYRYPVMGTTTREVKSSTKNTEVTQTSFINEKLINSSSLVTGLDKKEAIPDEISLSLYPNPFIEKLNYSYFLPKQMPVTIELIDITGKTIIELVKEQIQPEGFHSGNIDALKNHLERGMYSFRIKCGDSVIVSKAVKM